MPAYGQLPMMITRPGPFLAEGELQLGAEPTRPAEQVLLFANRLLQAVVARSENDANSDAGSPLSSFTLDVLVPALHGRLYGQAWAEREGTTVDFLRYRILDDRANPVVAGMATRHLSGGP